MRPSFTAGAAASAFAFAFAVAVASSYACSSNASDSSDSSGSSSSSGPASSSGGSSGGEPNDPDSGGSSSGAPDAPAPSGDVKVTHEQLVVGGQSRAYTLAVPVDYDPGRRYPLVMSFHGDGGTGAGMQEAWPFEAATKRSAIIAYPDGLGNAWDLDTTSAQNTDVQFVKELVAALAGRYSIDKGRILGSGYSKGGFFVNEMACRAGGFFKAIASHAGGAPYQERAGTTKDDAGFLICPGGPSPAFVFHGTADDGVAVGSGTFDAYYWSHVGGCAEPGTPDSAPATPRAPAPCTQYDGCPAGKPVTWCPFRGVGHVVAPGAQAIAWSYFTALP